nr:GNAT family N-acetyltransferase [Tomitella biformata]
MSTTALTLSSVGSFAGHSRDCTFWEMDPAMSAPGTTADPGLEKEAWLSALLLEWGSCGRMVWDGEALAGHALYAPPSDVPRSRLFPTSPVTADAVLLMSIDIYDQSVPWSAITPLMNAVTGDLVRRGVRAIEAFGYRESAPETEFDPSMLLRDVVTPGTGDCSPGRCMIPVGWLEQLGFQEVAPHHRYPRLRLELGRDLGWKAEVEAALEKLFDEAALVGSGSVGTMGAGLANAAMRAK